MTLMDTTALNFPPDYPTTLAQAVGLLKNRVLALSPGLGDALADWMQTLARGALEDYFLHPYAFPTLLLPWWFEGHLQGGVSLPLQQELIYSSMAGYYVIRLIDNVADDDDSTAKRLLPAIAVLHAEFQSSYGRLFPAGHAFWHNFHEQWAACHAASFADSALTDIDAEIFRTVSAKKVCAAMIPLMAVCHLHGLKALPADWLQLFDLLSQWHQFHNDFFDWKRDSDQGLHSYFLSEARRGAAENEDLLSWMARAGFDWGVGRLDGWMSDIRSIAAIISHPPLNDYLDMRQALLNDACAAVRPGLQLLSTLQAAGNQAPPLSSL